MPKAKLWTGLNEHAAQKGVNFMCPGCKETHSIRTARSQPGQACWEFNGNLDAPTFSPSVLVTSGHYVTGFEDGRACWCSYYAKHPEEERDFECFRCHSYVRDGMIQFLGDCTHALVGQTVPLPEFG